MNIVFLGTSTFAFPALERLLESPHKIMAVVTQPDRPKGRGLEIQPSPIKEIAREKGLHLLTPEDVNEYETVRELRALSPDAIVVVAYGQKLGNDILSLPRFLPLNIHPSILPRYRGPAPVARAIMNGETHTGVSIIKVIGKMDAGPICGVARTEIPAEATTPEMEEELSKVGADLLINVLDKVEQQTLVEVPQIERESTYARRFQKRDGQINWRTPARRIVNFVRALQPFPSAFSFCRGKRVTLYKVRGERAARPPRERPGSILGVDQDSFRVCCGDGHITVLELQPENKRRMTAAEFLRGRPFKPGDRLG